MSHLSNHDPSEGDDEIDAMQDEAENEVDIGEELGLAGEDLDDDANLEDGGSAGREEMGTIALDENCSRARS